MTDIDEYERIVSDNADKLIEKGYKQWRREKKKLRQDKKFISQEDRVRQIEENMLEQRTTKDSNQEHNTGADSRGVVG